MCLVASDHNSELFTQHVSVMAVPVLNDETQHVALLDER